MLASVRLPSAIIMLLLLKKNFNLKAKDTLRNKVDLSRIGLAGVAKAGDAQSVENTGDINRGIGLIEGTERPNLNYLLIHRVE